MFIDDGKGGLGEFWQQSPEVAIQAAFGTRIFQGASSSLMKGISTVRNKFPGVEGVNANSFFTLGVLKQRKETEKNKDVVEGLDAAIAIEEQKIKQAVSNGNNIVKKLDNKEVNSVANASTRIQETQEKIEDLKDQKDLGIIDNAQYETAVSGYNASIENDNALIDGIVEKAIEKENIRENDLSFKTSYDTFLEATRAQSEAKTSNRIALDAYIIKNKELQTKFDAGLITESELSNQKANNTQDYKNTKQQNDAVIEKVNKKLESVSSSSVKLSVELQKAFDDGVSEGTITKDADGKNVISNKVYQALEKTQEAFIKKISNTVYNAIPKGLLVADVTKADYEQNVKTEFLDLLRSYDGSTPLGAYLQTYLPKRAVRKRALQGISNQRFANDLESSAVQGMIAEEDAEIDVIENNINTAESLDISEDLMNEIRNVARTGLLTSQEKIDATKFKSGIAKTFKDALYANIKKALGLKNTKTNQGLTNAIEANPSAFYNAIAVESMRKARGKGGVNPFVEAGFLKDVNGVLQKVPLNELTVSKFLAYVTDPNIAKNTRSDRQMHLVEALAVSMGAREAINLLEGDIEFRQRFAEQQQQEQQTEEFKKAADKIQTKSFFTKLIEKISILRDANSVAKLLNISESGTVTDKNRTKVIDNLIKLAENGYLSPNAILAWNLASVGRRYKSLDENGTREYYLNDGTTSKPISKKNRIKFQKDNADLILPRPGGIFYAKTDPKFIQLELSAKENFKGKEIPKATKISLGTIKNIGKNGEITKAWKLEKAKQEAQNMEALEGAIKQLQKALAEGVSINDITPLIYAGYSTTSGIIKIAAPFKYVSKVFSYPPKNFGAKSQQYIGSKFREEHNPPASVVGATY